MSKLLFLGDFFYDYDMIKDDIEQISSWIKSNNYSVILNLEAPLCKSSSKLKKRGPNLYQSKIAIEVLKKLNVVGVCLANNHIMDYGIKALNETIEILDENNILHVGAGNNITEALKPMILTIDEKTIYIQNFAWDKEEAVYASEKLGGCSPRDNKIIISKTEELRNKNPESIIINIYHWGFEYNLYPMPYDIDLAHKSIDAGCNLIIGHHAHNIQSFEEYRNKEIYYSLGNFYFGSRRSRFKNRIFNHQIKNMCDYGAMVILDIISLKTDVKYIEYQYKLDKSIISKINESIAHLNNITNIDYRNISYVKLVKRNSININPILTLNPLMNFFKLIYLSMLYYILKVLRKLSTFMKPYRSKGGTLK